MHYGPFSIPHVISGLAVLFLYWAPLVSQKGSERHKRLGRWFLVSLAPVVASVIPIVFFDQGRREPAAFIQIIYLALCVGTVGFVSWNAVRRKDDLARFRNGLFLGLAVAMFTSGLLLLGVGMAEGKGLPIVFSMIGIGYGSCMLRFALLRSGIQPRWWLTWHAGSTCFLFSATHGSASAVLWKALFGPGDGDSVQIVAQTLGLAAAILLFVFMTKRHHIPIGFAIRPLIVRAA